MSVTSGFFCLWLSERLTYVKTSSSDYEARTLGAMVEKKTSSVTWHYRNADPEFGLFQGEGD